MTENLPDTNVGNIEYIRKQDAVDAFNRAVQDVGILDADDIETVFGMLSSADVAPVVHGKWTKLFYDGFNCNKCGSTFVIMQGRNNMYIAPTAEQRWIERSEQDGHFIAYCGTYTWHD